MRATKRLSIPPDLLAGYRFAAVAVADNGQELPEPVEVAVTHLDGATVGATRTWLTRPIHAIAPWATRGHGLRGCDVHAAPELRSVADDIQSALADRLVITHRAPQCYDTLSASVPAIEAGPILDLRRLADRTWPSVVSQALGALELHAGLEVPGTLGRADHDAQVTAWLLIHAAAELARPAERLIEWATFPEGNLK